MLKYGRLPIEDIQLIAHWELLANKSIRAFEFHNGVEVETWQPKSPYCKFGKILEQMCDSFEEAMKAYGV